MTATTIFAGGPVDHDKRLSNALGRDAWFLETAATLSGWSRLLDQERRIEAAEKALPVSAPRIEHLPARVRMEDSLDLLAAARISVDQKLQADAHGAAIRAIEQARSELRADATRWLQKHSGAILDVLHVARSSVASNIRALTAQLGDNTDLEVIARRPDLAQIVADLVPLVDQWRSFRALHLAITGVNELKPQAAGSIQLLRFPHLDWAADYADAWPTFYEIAGGGLFPWADASTLDIAFLITRFPKVWTPTSDEFERAQSQLTRQATRLAAESTESRRQRLAREQAQGGGIPPQRIHERVIPAPAEIPAHELVAASRMDPR